MIIKSDLECRLFWSQNWVKNGCKTWFSENDPGPFGMHKQVVLARFEPVVGRSGPPKNPKCLESEGFWNQKWVKKVRVGVLGLSGSDAKERDGGLRVNNGSLRAMGSGLIECS